MASPGASGLFLFGDTPSSVFTTIMLLPSVQCVGGSKLEREVDERRPRPPFPWDIYIVADARGISSCTDVQHSSSALPTNNPCPPSLGPLFRSIRRASFPSSHVHGPDAMPQLCHDACSFTSRLVTWSLLRLFLSSMGRDVDALLHNRTRSAFIIVDSGMGTSSSSSLILRIAAFPFRFTTASTEESYGGAPDTA
ncbi:hypothetical protein BDP81DRAFT_162964 [Colletotrichum phormii]|uniref:Uncharacterized protein n=1 Tax=Colletotrichum phormii TaxID=359342 RepID=A0AAJ0A1J0_9PEZI|nr:uncharacterized protein BDP81DRAFT_162964 [Colletotrichum phormii]KAK1640412.1 hypothetical protein BDP81DRAFT_162964 [Colletotrichum phormii]